MPLQARVYLLIDIITPKKRNTNKSVDIFMIRMLETRLKLHFWQLSDKIQQQPSHEIWFCVYFHYICIFKTPCIVDIIL